MQRRGCYFIERNGDYFMHVVAYLPKEKVHNGRAIGIDLGIKNQILERNKGAIRYTNARKDKEALQSLFKISI
ncbi:MAG: hypothetical protein QXG99_07915 [Conexivisphaerales archaeon]